MLYTVSPCSTLYVCAGAGRLRSAAGFSAVRVRSVVGFSAVLTRSCGVGFGVAAVLAVRRRVSMAVRSRVAAASLWATVARTVSAACILACAACATTHNSSSSSWALLSVWLAATFGVSGALSAAGSSKAACTLGALSAGSGVLAAVSVSACAMRIGGSSAGAGALMCSAGVSAVSADAVCVVGKGAGCFSAAAVFCGGVSGAGGVRVKGGVTMTTSAVWSGAANVLAAKEGRGVCAAVTGGVNTGDCSTNVSGTGSKSAFTNAFTLPMPCMVLRLTKTVRPAFT